MASIRNLKEKNGNVFYPLTHERAVRDSNGVSLDTKLAGLESKSYVEAWDGASTPVEANIPEGVVVTYNTTTYTGTLDASASTIGKIYLVKNGNNYDRYITSQSGNTYSWVPNGSTEMDLSGYATDEELNQVDAKIDNMMPTVIEDGFYIIDSDRNIGFYVDENGIATLIMSVLSTLFTTTTEDGFYIVDSDRNIGFMVNANGAHSANLVEY